MGHSLLWEGKLFTQEKNKKQRYQFTDTFFIFITIENIQYYLKIIKTSTNKELTSSLTHPYIW